MDTTMKELAQIEKLSVLHCVYQLIASADGGIDEERDHEAVTLAIDAVALTSSSWSQALRINPHDAFYHLSSIRDDQKSDFRELLLRITEMGGHREFRITCAKHLFELCNVLEP